MTNPFEVIEARLSNIENMLLDLKHPVKNDSVPQSDLMTVAEAADFLDLTIPTIYTKTSRGELPFMKRSKRLYFSREELVKYLKKGRQGSLVEFGNNPEDLLKPTRRKVG